MLTNLPRRAPLPPLPPVGSGAFLHFLKNELHVEQVPFANMLTSIYYLPILYAFVLAVRLDDHVDGRCAAIWIIIDFRDDTVTW